MTELMRKPEVHPDPGHVKVGGEPGEPTKVSVLPEIVT